MSELFVSLEKIFWGSNVWFAVFEGALENPQYADYVKKPGCRVSYFLRSFFTFTRLAVRLGPSSGHSKTPKV